jgi:hypothetical protein
MRDDLLKERLIDYARSGAEVAFQPGPADIHRRARRHVQRLAALTAAGVLVAGAVGLGLRHAASVPIVNQPRPPVTVAPHPAGPPDSFVTVVRGGAGADSGDLAVVSTRTGKMLRSLAPATSTTFTVTGDRKWVYFESSMDPGIYRVPYAGGAATKVADGTEITRLQVSPDGSRLAWQATSGNRPAVRVHDLASGSERVLAVPGPLTGPRVITLGDWVWSPDGRQLAVLVIHGVSSGYQELKTVDVATGTWRHRFDFDASHGGGPDCCEAIAWPAGSRGIAVLQAIHAGGEARDRRLVYVDPATGATTPGPVLAGPDATFGSRLEFDASGRYLLFGLQFDHSVSTWWVRGGGNPVLVKRIEIGDQPPAEVAGAYVGGDW